MLSSIFIVFQINFFLKRFPNQNYSCRRIPQPVLVQPKLRDVYKLRLTYTKRNNQNYDVAKQPR
jgi:hypothetical protein